MTTLENDFIQLLTFQGAPASLADPDFKPDDYGLSHTGMTLKCTASINTHDWQKVPVPRPQVRKIVKIPLSVSQSLLFLTSLGGQGEGKFSRALSFSLSFELLS